MKENKIKSPILLMTYKKDSSLGEILNSIIEYNPPKLYISRNIEENKSEEILVKNVETLINQFYFPFEIEIINNVKHLSINDSFFNSLNFVFENEDRIIVLEDDTIPNQSFFEFCSSMLEKYKNDDVSYINGCNLGCANEKDSCFYSRFSLPLWGWATWANKWKAMLNTTNVKEKVSALNFESNEYETYLKRKFVNFVENRNFWDMDLAILSIVNNKKVIVSGVNMVKNKGYCKNATTTFFKSNFSDLSVNNFDINDFQLKDNLKERYIKKIAEFLKEFENCNYE